MQQSSLSHLAQLEDGRVGRDGGEPWGATGEAVGCRGLLLEMAGGGRVR
jgi:hypothetical protein